MHGVIYGIRLMFLVRLRFSILELRYVLKIGTTIILVDNIIKVGSSKSEV